MQNFIKLKLLIQNLQISNHYILNSTLFHNENAHIRLPKIELKKFKGDFKEFRSFIDHFNNLVHNKNTLSGVEKLDLFSSLEGKPLSLVKHLPNTADNYKIAYETINKH